MNSNVVKVVYCKSLIFDVGLVLYFQRNQLIAFYYNILIHSTFFAYSSNIQNVRWGEMFLRVSITTAKILLYSLFNFDFGSTPLPHRKFESTPLVKKGQNI